MAILKSLTRWPRQHFVALATIAWLAWAFGQLLRDVNWFTGMCFYIPSPVLALFLAGGAVAKSCQAIRRRRPLWPSLYLVVLASAPAFFVVALECHSPPTTAQPTPERSPDERAVSLVHWNVLYGQLGWEGVEETLAGLEAEIYALSELAPDTDVEATAKRLGSGYTGLRMENMAVFARGRLSDPRWVYKCRNMDAFQVDCHVGDGRPVRVLVADLASDLRVARNPLLKRFRRVLRREQPDVVVGDFNAPRRSRALRKLPLGYQHAYELCGSGWSYTWPVPLPVYAIDQCIVSPDLDVARYDLRSTRFSDHRLQQLWFRRPVAALRSASTSPSGRGNRARVRREGTEHALDPGSYLSK